MLIVCMQVLFGVAALASCIVACILVLRRNSLAPLLMVHAGVFGLIFFCSLGSFHFEMAAVALLLAVAGAILMVPLRPVGSIDDREVGESTATRRRR